MCVHTCSCIGFDVMSGLAKDQDLTFYLQMPLLLSNIKGFKKDFVWFQKPKRFPKRSTHCFKTNLKRKCVVWFKTLNALFSKSKGLEKVLRRVRTMPLFPRIFPTFFGIKFLFIGFLSFFSINPKVLSGGKTTLVVFLILPSIPRIFSRIFRISEIFFGA